MPTASEYRHEPYGIPCHCYVRRRINRSLSRKSCLRRPQHCADELARPPKSVSFDPVLRVRSYRSQFRCDDFQKPLPEESSEGDAFQPGVHSRCATKRPDGSQLVDAGLERSPSGLSPKTNFNWALCDAITSFLGFQKVSNSLDGVRTGGARRPRCGAGNENCAKAHVDENNNDDTAPLMSEMDRSRHDEPIYGNHRNCPAGVACKYASRPRERTPPRRNRLDDRPAAGRNREQAVGSSGNQSRSSSSSWEYGNFAVRKPALDCGSDTSSHYAPRGGGSTTSPYQVSGPDCGTSSRTDDCYSDGGGCCPPAYEAHSTMPPLSTFQCPSARDDSSATNASIAAQSSQDGDDRTTEKSDEYIYESPDNRNNREYEYVPVKSSLRRRTESENLDSCPTVPAFDGVGGGNLYGGGGGFVKHKTESDLSVEAGSPEKGGGHHPRVDVLMTPQSAPDLQAIMSSPYDIKFLNECVKAYVRSAGDSELEIDILAKIQTIEGTERAPLNRRGGAGGFGIGGGRKSPVMDDIFKMTPVALFWTGCAFLIALIYIILFSCAKDHED